MSAKFTLSELNEKIKDALVGAFPAEVWVIAEVSELKENRSGHCYLELIEKEENTIKARSRATIWSYTYRMLKPYFETTTGQLFSHGIKILVQVSVEYHAAFGLSLNVKDIDPTYTVGDMALQRKEIIDRLKADGVFEMNKELDLALVPQRIAIISSATAAGYQDFIAQLNGNEYKFKFYTKLFEAYMQGADAMPSIINALERIFQYENYFDAVVVIRGGGATADLNSFDNYDLAVNIAQFPIPVVTGIGHEKDDTVIDLVAHTRLKTPTAAASFFIHKVNIYFQRLLELENGVGQLTHEVLNFQKEKLESIAEGLKYSLSGFINDKQMELTQKGNALQQSVSEYSFRRKYELNNLRHSFDTALSVWLVETKNKINKNRRILKRVVGEVVFKNKSSLARTKNRLANKSRKIIYQEQERIHINENTVRLLNPENVLTRGYALALKQGKVVKSTKELNVNEKIEIQFIDGKVESKIIKK